MISVVSSRRRCAMQLPQDFPTRLEMMYGSGDSRSCSKESWMQASSIDLLEARAAEWDSEDEQEIESDIEDDVMMHPTASRPAEVMNHTRATQQRPTPSKT